MNEPFRGYARASLVSRNRMQRWRFWLERHGIDADEEMVDRIFRRAKSSTTVLTEQDFLTEVAHARAYASTRLDA